jgi:hypothetical protein
LPQRQHEYDVSVSSLRFCHRLGLARAFPKANLAERCRATRALRTEVVLSLDAFDSSHAKRAESIT